MNIEGLCSYQNAVNCMNKLNKLEGIEAHIKVGGLGFYQLDITKLKEVKEIVEEFGGVITEGLTLLQELTLPPEKIIE